MSNSLLRTEVKRCPRSPHPTPPFEIEHDPDSHRLPPLSLFPCTGVFPAAWVTAPALSRPVLSCPVLACAGFVRVSLRGLRVEANHIATLRIVPGSPAAPPPLLHACEPTNSWRRSRAPEPTDATLHLVVAPDTEWCFTRRRREEKRRSVEAGREQEKNGRNRQMLLSNHSRINEVLKDRGPGF